MMNLGQVLSDWRWMQKLSKPEAAMVIGVPVSAINQLECGKDCHGGNLAIILRWLLEGQAVGGTASEPLLALEDQSCSETAEAVNGSR